jgi:hypothetical protein
MKPHVERAQAINAVYRQNLRDDELAPEGTSPGMCLTSHEFDRELSLEAERGSLGEAESHAQGAADDAAAAESERYRRERGSSDDA